MSIVDYATLSSSLSKWTKRSDLTALMPDFVQLAEQKFNRALRVREMETVLPTTAFTGFSMARPASFLAFKALWSTAEPLRTLTAKPLDLLIDNEALERPKHYAVGSDIRFDSAAGSVAGVYYASIPSLVTAANWLVAAAPDLYLAGVLTEAYLYTFDEARAGIFTARTEALISEINAKDSMNRYSGPLSL